MNPLVSFLSVAAAFFLLAASSGLAVAQEQTFRLTIKNHQFEPAEFEIPANTKVTLQVKNEDPTAEEFESSTLHREKVVPAGKEVSIFVGPLSPGRYEFMGDFNRATARGAIIVK
jgi:plastocyanin